MSDIANVGRTARKNAAWRLEMLSDSFEFTYGTPAWVFSVSVFWEELPVSLKSFNINIASAAKKKRPQKLLNDFSKFPWSI